MLHDPPCHHRPASLSRSGTLAKVAPAVAPSFSMRRRSKTGREAHEVVRSDDSSWRILRQGLGERGLVFASALLGLGAGLLSLGAGPRFFLAEPLGLRQCLADRRVVADLLAGRRDRSTPAA